MSDPSTWQALEAARYQADLLGNFARAQEIAQAAWDTADAEGRYHLEELLGWLARRTSVSPGERSFSGVGQVFCLFYDADQSQEAFVALLAVQPAEVAGCALPPRCGAAFAAAIDDGELALLRYLRQRHRLEPRRTLLEGKRFEVRGPRAATAFIKDGSSIGAAAAVALYSLWTETPVPADLLVTGQLSPDGALLAVGAIAQKVRAALRERPHFRAMIVPAACFANLPPELRDARVIPADDLESLLTEIFGENAALSAPATAVDIEGTVAKGLELYAKRNNFVAAREVLTLALFAIEDRRQQSADPSLFAQEEFFCLWRIGSCLTHGGDVQGATTWLQRAQNLGETLWQRGEIDPQAYLGFHGNLAVLLRDTFQYAAAERLLRETLALQHELRQDKRQRAKVLGNLGELLTFAGRHAEAEQLLFESLEHLRATYLDEVPRALCYLGNLALAQERPEEAQARFEEGLALNREVEYGRVLNEAFLRYGLARALYQQRRYEQAIDEVDRALATQDAAQPYPRQLALQYRGLARLATGAAAEGLADLAAAADLTHVRGSLLRFGVSTALAHLALHLLRHNRDSAQREEIAACAEQLAAAVGDVPGLSQGARLAREIRAMLTPFTTRGTGGERLAALLEESIAAFPY